MTTPFLPPFHPDAQGLPALGVLLLEPEMPTTHHSAPLDAGVARLVQQLDDGRREAFEERAGIFEFDAKLPRLEAEQQALIQTLARYGFPGAPAVRLLQVQIAGATQWILSGNEIATRRALAGLGAGEVVEVDLADTLQRQFGSLAVLAIFP